ncbi:MAG: ammonia channel protein, partial [Gammaproteobacteria bacterium]|nr:ammonia channel protein [Gammaproteobacteria bacterium]
MNGFFKIMLAALGLGIAGLAAAEPAVATVGAAVASAVVDAASAVAPAAEIVPTVSKGDVAWLLMSTVLVVFMAVPGLALFYGGLVRAKNMLSVLMQVLVVFSLISVLWVVYGYSLAFGGEGLIIGSFDKLFLSG